MFKMSSTKSRLSRVKANTEKKASQLARSGKLVSSDSGERKKAQKSYETLRKAGSYVARNM